MMNNTNGEKFPESEKLLSDTPTSFSVDDEAHLLNLSEEGNKKSPKMHHTPRLLALLVVFGLLALGAVSASTKEFHIRRPFADCSRTRPVIAPHASPPAPEEIEKFKELLNSVEPASLHEVLHEHLKEKYQHGVYQEDRTAMEVVHKQDAAVAQSLIELAKRQSNTTTVVTTSVGSTVTQAGTTTTVDPTTSVPSTSVAPPTTTTQAPTTSVPTTVVTSTLQAPTQTETSTQAPTTSGAKTSSQTTQAPGSTRNSNSAVTSGPSSSGPASSTRLSSSIGPTSSNRPASSNGPSSGSASSTGSPSSSIPSSATSSQGSSSPTSIQESTTISSSSSNTVETTSGNTSDSSSIATPTTGAGTTSIPSDSSITQQVVYKTTLANGAQSTVTSITIVPANQAQSGGSSKTSGGSASLQTNAASSRDIGVNALLGVLGMAAVAAL